MNILSYNIRGLYNPNKKDVLRNVVWDHKLNIFLDQEIRMLIDKVELLSFFKNGKGLDHSSQRIDVICNEAIVQGLG